jgi:hypothetical protein
MRFHHGFQGYSSLSRHYIELSAGQWIVKPLRKVHSETPAAQKNLKA